jgi:hypothetical protein
MVQLGINASGFGALNDSAGNGQYVGRPTCASIRFLLYRLRSDRTASYRFCCCFSLFSPWMKRREMMLYVTFESSSSYFGSQRWNRALSIMKADGHN